MARQQRRKVGRPPKPMPDPIPDTPENVARALLTSPPRRPDDWEYKKQRPRVELPDGDDCGD